MSSPYTFLVGGSEEKPSDPGFKLIYFNIDTFEYEVFNTEWSTIKLEHLIN